MRTELLNNLIEKTKKTPYPFGIEVKQHKLTREEKHYLVDKEINIHGPGRKRSFILVYPQHLRARDLREIVNKKRSKENEIQRQKSKSKRV